MEEYEAASKFAPSTKKPKIPEEDGESVDQPCWRRQWLGLGQHDSREIQQAEFNNVADF